MPQQNFDNSQYNTQWLAEGLESVKNSWGFRRQQVSASGAC